MGNLLGVAAFVCLALDAVCCCSAAAAGVRFSSATSSLVAGEATDSGINFRSQLIAQDRVSVDFDIDLKRVHADIDFGLETLTIHSFYRGTGTPAGLSITEMAGVLALGKEISVPVGGRHVEALGGLINILSIAPLNTPLDIDNSGLKNEVVGYTSICGQLGQPATASFTVSKQTRTAAVTVGPMCYVSPALGRCGMAGGPDPIIGWEQRFTQECLNHDACCAATQDRTITVHGTTVNVCGYKGNDCLPQFRDAVPGFLFAPSCGSTEGHWKDVVGFQFVIHKGSDLGSPQPFNGLLKTGVSECPKFDVSGTRTGTTMTLTATNPDGDSPCTSSITIDADYADCNTATGTLGNAEGYEQGWSWSRTSVVGDVTPPAGGQTAALMPRQFYLSKVGK